MPTTVPGLEVGRTLIMVDRSADPPAEINHSWKRAWAAWVIAGRCHFAVLVGYNSTITGAWSRAHEMSDPERWARDIGFSPLGSRDTDACTRVASRWFSKDEPLAQIVIVTNERAHTIADVEIPYHFHHLPQPAEIR